MILRSFYPILSVRFNADHASEKYREAVNALSVQRCRVIPSETRRESETGERNDSEQKPE